MGHYRLTVIREAMSVVTAGKPGDGDSNALLSRAAEVKEQFIREDEYSCLMES